jgi:diadenosine tetraphosphatase ApaH/serine/threonine PP2A family protein phosphatase
MLAGISERTVVFGHSHQQFRRHGPNGTDLVNPGSVGMPLDGDVRAAWATWDGDFELRRTEYDVARAVAGYRSMGGEFGEFAARRIERGSD